MKKIWSMLLSICLCMTMLTGCGDGEAKKTETKAKTEQSTEKENDNDTKEVEIAPADFSKAATEFVKEMKVGWNLGNSLDAYSNKQGNETAWGNPYITKELIQAVKAAGFTTIRIPVTYMGKIGAAPEYTIDEKWLNRVKVVTDVALNEGLYVIINIHHDGNNDIENGAWLDVNAANQTEVQTKFTAVWEQIASTFKGYNEKLIFESMNEIMEYGNYGNPNNASTYDNINALNQIFVDTVRKTGGNNTERYLLVPGYNTNINATLLEAFTIPEDTAKDKLMVSVHFYDPWNYAGMGYTDGWGEDAKKTGLHTDGWGQEDWVDEAFGKMNEAFVKKGIPVILGEYGAVYQSEEKEDNRAYYMKYVTKSALDNGMCPIVWDNGSTRSGQDAFGIFDRRNKNTILHPKYLDAIVNAKQ